MLTFVKDRKPDFATNCLNRTIEEAVGLCREDARHREISLYLQTAAGMPEAEFDRQGVSDAALNLIGNAIESCAEWEAGEVWVSTRYDPESQSIEFSVANTGVGIPDDIKDKIFEPFFSTKGAKGTGLGLANSRKIAVEHGGTLELVQTDELTTFVFRIPAARSREFSPQSAA